MTFETGGRKLRYIDFNRQRESMSEDEYEEAGDGIEVSELNEATVICSDTRMNGWHKPVIDFDLPIEVIPSSTEGHGHLYIDKRLSWSDYVKLLEVLVEVGLVEEGYLNASVARGYTAVRLPWIMKGQEELPPAPSRRGGGSETLRDVMTEMADLRTAFNYMSFTA